MEETLLLPIDARRAWLDIFHSGTPYHSGMQFEINEMAKEFPELSMRKLRKKVNTKLAQHLKMSQCFISQFADRKKVAVFWLTPTLARKYLDFYKTLLTLNQRDVAAVKQTITEVALSPPYSHVSSIAPGQTQAPSPPRIDYLFRVATQSYWTLLDPDYNRKVHAFWVDDVAYRAVLVGTGDQVSSWDAIARKCANEELDSLRNLLVGCDKKTRLDLQWFKLNMTWPDADDAFSIAHGQVNNPEPMTPPERPAAPYTQTEWSRYASANEVYQRGLQCQPPRGHPHCGLLDIIVSVEGLTFTALQRPNQKTPVLPWKWIRKVALLDYVHKEVSHAPRQRIVLRRKPS